MIDMRNDIQCQNLFCQNDYYPKLLLKRATKSVNLRIDF